MCSLLDDVMSHVTAGHKGKKINLCHSIKNVSEFTQAIWSWACNDRQKSLIQDAGQRGPNGQIARLVFQGANPTLNLAVVAEKCMKAMLGAGGSDLFYPTPLCLVSATQSVISCFHQDPGAAPAPNWWSYICSVRVWPLGLETWIRAGVSLNAFCTKQKSYNSKFDLLPIGDMSQKLTTFVLRLGRILQSMWCPMCVWPGKDFAAKFLKNTDGDGRGDRC